MAGWTASLGKGRMRHEAARPEIKVRGDADLRPVGEPRKHFHFPTSCHSGKLKPFPSAPPRQQKTAATFRPRDFARPTEVRERRRGRSVEHLSSAEPLPKESAPAGPAHPPGPALPSPSSAPPAATGCTSCRARNLRPARAETRLRGGGARPRRGRGCAAHQAGRGTPSRP